MGDICNTSEKISENINKSNKLIGIKNMTISEHPKHQNENAKKMFYF